MVLGSGLTCRVVSAEVKHSNCHHFDRTTLSGPLEVVGVGKRYCSVQGGWLEVHGSQKPHTKIPLRGLHLVSGGWLTFRLLGQGYSLTFKSEREDDYWRWVRCLAAELLRQTPLTSIPYLDILGITGALRRAQSEGSLAPSSPSLPDVVADTCRPRHVGGEGSRERVSPVDYMPVRERRRIWEEMSSGSPGHGGSLCNLSEACRAANHLSVRQLCRLFESSTSSLPPRLSSAYVGMKENIPSLLNSRPETEETRGRKQFRISEMKFRHHSNIR